MNSKDLNSINEAYVQATTKVVTKEAGKTVDEATDRQKSLRKLKKSVRFDGPEGKRIGGTKPEQQGGRLRAKNRAKKDQDAQRDWSGDPRTRDLGGLRDKEDEDEPTPELSYPKSSKGHWKKKTAKKAKESVKEDLGPDFGDPSRHSDDPLDDDWTPEKGDTVEVEHPGSDKKVGTIVGIVDPDKKDEDVPVRYNIEFPGGDTEVHPKDHIVLDEPSEDDPGPDAGDDAGDSGEDPWDIENSKVSNLMDGYESRLASHKYRVREKTESSKDFKKPDESVSGVDKKTQRPKGEVKADEKSKDVGDVKKDLQEPVESEEKDDEKNKKVGAESINNSNKGNIMSEDKSIFDKLYEQVMGEDDDFELGLPGDDAGLDIGDELGDEGGEDVTVTLTPDQADAIRAVADQLAPPGDDEEELGLGDDEPVDDESFEGVEEGDETSSGKPTTDGAKPGVDPSDGGGKATDPAADSLGGKSTGTGDAKVTDDDPTTGKDTGEGKKPGVAKGAGKPGSQKANSKT